VRVALDSGASRPCQCPCSPHTCAKEAGHAQQVGSRAEGMCGPAHPQRATNQKGKPHLFLNASLDCASPAQPSPARIRSGLLCPNWTGSAQAAHSIASHLRCRHLSVAYCHCMLLAFRINRHCRTLIHLQSWPRGELVVKRRWVDEACSLHSTAQHSTAQPAQLSTAWHCTTQHSTAWHGSSATHPSTSLPHRLHHRVSMCPLGR
jgi:hypothetical protein